MSGIMCCLYKWGVFEKYKLTLLEMKISVYRTIIKMAIIKIRHDSKSKKDDIVLLK